MWRKDYLLIFGVWLTVTTALFGYYLTPLSPHIEEIYKNWDGPSYVLAAQSLYVPKIAAEHNFMQAAEIYEDWTWLPAHFPLYPLLIRLFSPLGWFQAMLFLSQIFTLGTLFAFYSLLVTHRLSNKPLLLTLSFILLSPRWFIVSHTGSSEPLFLFFLLLTLNFFLQKRHGVAAIFAALCQACRPQGALLGLSLALIALIELWRTQKLKKIIATYYPYLSIPLMLLFVFGFYLRQTGDFWAFFSAISIFHHFEPSFFPVFHFPGSNLETFWQEVNVYDYLLGFSGCFLVLKNKSWQLGLIGFVFLLPLVFLKHSDISRYLIPILPFILIGFSDVVERLEFQLGLWLMSPAIYLYALNFMHFNRTG